VSTSKKQVVKDQTVTNYSGKFDIGESISVGLGTFRAGAIQLSGGNGVGGNVAPTGDVTLDSTALMLNYNLTENVSFLGGITQNSLKDGNVTTLAGSYDVSGATETGYLFGAAYSIPEIALKAEITYQPKTKFATKTAFAPSQAMICGAVALNGGDCANLTSANAQIRTGTQLAYDGAEAALTDNASATSLSLPETFAVNFQTGIATDTLLTASYRQASWGQSQIKISAPATAAIETQFADSEAYSIGIGRKFSEALSGSLTYSKEGGGSSTSKSLFTVSNGSEAISIGLQYKLENMTVSGGISKRNVGDVTVTDAAAGQMIYKGNSVTAMGVKIAFAF
jgi:long-chain fatty acid transport protein